MKKIAFFTLGCKVNQYETETLRKQLLKYFQEVDFSDTADIYIINTCCVTEVAETKSKKIIKRAIRHNPDAFIIITGCLAEINSFEIEKTGRVLVIPQRDKQNIPEIVKERFRPEIQKDYYERKRTRVFIKIQDGCNRFCSYCIIPYIRGKSRSRNQEEILKEIKLYIEEGAKEIVLTGICLGDYGRDISGSLAELLKKIENLEGNFRIRLSSIELNDIDEELKKVIFSSKKICHHFHIPLQSGDRNILKLMNRNYTPEEYLETVYQIRDNISDVAITTDIMVGFPQENEEEFKNTLKLVEEIKFYRIHIFPYSKRPKTKASKYKFSLDRKTIEKRSKILSEIASFYKKEFEKKFIGKTLDVLVENFDEKLKLFTGISGNYIRVFLKAEENIKGNIVPVKIKDVGDFVYGELFQK